MQLLDVQNRRSDRCGFEGRSRTSCMEDRDLLGLVLAGIAVMMFLTGIVLIM
ncbi:hypothetical protein [Halalkalirubrum salinum]|uniref:hypothetical protein n=1 Tax=Halalkalirubrum salinum TaxID=2563889 RepID=UPI0014857231|nr:hypothetical protein [Halalkalirubrum salinum]